MFIKQFNSSIPTIRNHPLYSAVFCCFVDIYYCTPLEEVIKTYPLRPETFEIATVENIFIRLLFNFVVHSSLSIIPSVLGSLFFTGAPLPPWPTRKISRCQAHAMFRLLHTGKSSRQPKVHGPFGTGQKYLGM